jgi:hypothetical protein
MNWDTNFLGIMTALLFLISIRLYLITKELDCMHDHLHNLDHYFEARDEIQTVIANFLEAEVANESKNAEAIAEWDNGA